jgi:hypothetical protein
MKFDLLIADGKYTVHVEHNGSLTASRYGAPWRNLSGDNLVFHLAYELDEARKTIDNLLKGSK